MQLDHIEYRKLKGIKEFQACEDLQLKVWGFSERELFPARHLLTAQQNGGLVLGAFNNLNDLVGYSYAFLGSSQGKYYLYSHMLGLLEEYKYKNIGMYEEAVKSYKQAIESFPDDPIAYNNIAYLYADMGVNLEEALRYAETSIKLDPNNRGYYFDTLGWIYYRMNDFTRAKEFLEKSVFYNPSAIRKYHLAQVYKKLNMKDKALIELQGAQVIQPIGKLAEQVKNEIYELQN